MNSIRLNIALLFVLVYSISMGQVELDEQLILTGPTDNERQIAGLDYPSDSSNAVSAGVHQSGELIYSVASGTDSLMVSVSPTPNAYEPGMVINFKASATNRDSVMLNLNGLGYVSVLKFANQQLDSNDIYIGQLVSVIFDGLAFQVISELNKRCPSGFVQVSNQFCIEQEERTAETFWNAVVACFNEDARLCDWNEWYQSCIDSSLGLNDMVNNWEWCDNAVNWHTGSNQSYVRIAGETDCTDAANGLPTTGGLRNYRCCYSK